jgi:hypothetical protein
MDALFHLVIAITGGYLLACAMRLKKPALGIILLSFASMIPDLEHLTEYVGINWSIVLHSIFIVLIPLSIYAFLIIANKWKNRRNYLLILSVMLSGHLIMDTVAGMNGIELFYPLSRRSYLMPESWEAYLFNDRDKPLASTYAIGLALYYGAIGLIAITYRQLFARPSKGA